MKKTWRGGGVGRIASKQAEKWAQNLQKYKIGMLTIDTKIQCENLNYRWAVIMQMERLLAYRLLPSPFLLEQKLT
jgi:hypothetical protein